MTGRLAYLPSRRINGGGAHAAVQPACWTLEAAPNVMMRVKRIFPRAEQSRARHIVLADTPEVARDLAWVLQRWPLDLDETALQRLAVRAGQHHETEMAVDRVLSGERLAFELEPARPLRDYQIAAADLAISTRRLLLGDDVGLGKTAASLGVLRAPDALPALVVTLTHLPTQWERETHTLYPGLTTHLLRGTRPYDPASRCKGHDPDVLITPYSRLHGWADVLAGRVRTVIFDEIQELRRPDTLRYAAAARIADSATYKIGASASPVYNYGGEIHAVVSVLAPDALGSRTEFTREWCADTANDKLVVRDPRALGAHLRSEGLLLRRTRADVRRELPDAIRVEHHVDADTEPLADPDLAELARTMLDTTDRAQRWQASGELDWRLRQATGIAKAPHVADFVRLLLESEERIVLYGWHRSVYDTWLERLKAYNPVLYTGTESPAAKERSRDAFVGGDARVLIMSLRSGAGLDGLQTAARVAVFGELDWSPGVHDQAIGRLHRDGQPDPVVAYFLVSDTGSDPVVADVLGIKRAQSEPIRDPDAPLLAAGIDTSDRVRQLARHVLGRTT